MSYRLRRTFRRRSRRCDMLWRATSSLLERASLYSSRCDDNILLISEDATSNMPHAAPHCRVVAQAVRYQQVRQ